MARGGRGGSGRGGVGGVAFGPVPLREERGGGGVVRVRSRPRAERAAFGVRRARPFSPAHAERPSASPPTGRTRRRSRSSVAYGKHRHARSSRLRARARVCMRAAGSHSQSSAVRGSDSRQRLVVSRVTGGGRRRWRTHAERQTPSLSAIAATCVAPLFPCPTVVVLRDGARRLMLLVFFLERPRSYASMPVGGGRTGSPSGVT